VSVFLSFICDEGWLSNTKVYSKKTECNDNKLELLY
jgi:hypothetical protein